MKRFLIFALIAALLLGLCACNTPETVTTGENTLPASTGDTNAEIAQRLGISVATVKSHVLHLMEKTGFKTRTELVSEARGLGIVIKNKREE